PVLVLAQVHQVNLVADAVAREVDDDVEPFGDALLVESGEPDGARQQVAVVPDLDDFRAVAERDLEETRDARIQDTEAVLAALDFKVRLVEQVHRHDVAEEAVEVEDVERELAVAIPRLVGDEHVDVVVEIPPRLFDAARQPQVDAVLDFLVSAIEAAE